MNLNLRLSCRAFLFCLALASSVVAQNTNSTVTTVQVPRLMRISGTLNLWTDAGGVSAAGAATSQPDLHRTSGVVGVTFALYAEETGGAPLWLETQNVQVDNTGHYSVLLGSTQAEGLPIELFTSGQAQWLGVQQQGQTEQPRIMLFSVPYALKAADAETFGGKPPSAYASAQPEQTESPTNPAPTAAPANGSGGSSNSPHPLPITGSGTTNYLPIWTSASNLASSVVYQSSGGLGIGTTTPQALLDVRGNVQFAITGGTTQTSGVGVSGVNQATTGNGVGVQGQTSSSAGVGLAGLNSAMTGGAEGVVGQTASTSGIAVLGLATSSTTTGNPFGVVGRSSSPTGTGGAFGNAATSGNAYGATGLTQSAGGTAIYGLGVEASSTGQTLTSFPIGVWGDTGESGGAGVVGTADDGVAVEGRNDSTNIATADFENKETSSTTAPILAAHATNIGGSCLMDAGGDLYCNGTKSGVVPVDGGSRKVALYAVEAPENWFEDLGSGQITNGSAVVSLDPTFAQTINSELKYHVFLTPTGDCKGLYVSQETATSFEVHELGGGTSSVGFDYRIMARRKGYEDIRLADKTAQFSRAGARGNRMSATTQPRNCSFSGI